MVSGKAVAWRSRPPGMIVMGSRGLSGLPHLLIGSIAEHVVQRSPVTVTIVKHAKEEANAE